MEFTAKQIADLIQGKVEGKKSKKAYLVPSPFYRIPNTCILYTRLNQVLY